MTTTSIPSQASADSAMPPVFLTVDQVAKRLNVEIKHLRFGRLIRVSLSDLNEYLSSKLQANLLMKK
jgi:hypothetical protein